MQNVSNDSKQYRETKSGSSTTFPMVNERFEAAQKQLQKAVEKHVQDYQSSSSEDELESSECVLSGILKNYEKINDRSDELSLDRTTIFIQQSLQSGASICLICISKVRRDNPIWSCAECYSIFHLNCVQRWAKDSIVQQKNINEVSNNRNPTNNTWACPKCRHVYNYNEIPKKYQCYCKKLDNPQFEPLLAPHSCGEICGKLLKPLCGHKCLLLCHPGPCPACPVTVAVTCHCQKGGVKSQRCSVKTWSCGGRCGKQLSCDRHTCPDKCHPDQCQPCQKKSLQKCQCQSEQKLRDCATPNWQCTKVCTKLLACANHECKQMCHTIGACPPCELSKSRLCPCGKNAYQLPCTEEVPSCGSICGKILDCGQHSCYQTCHRNNCGICTEIVEKSCRCGASTKTVQCSKPFLCGKKCKLLKDCNRHPCNRKCCDGNCSPCEKPCDRTLNCRRHKCTSICHTGPCYPCNRTDIVQCYCGTTQISVPCGRKHKVKPPKCNALCRLPPNCHHEKRANHRCHFGPCPPCRLVCNKPLTGCGHLCPNVCHSVVAVKTSDAPKPSMPWDDCEAKILHKELPCAECQIPTEVYCYGQHEKEFLPCFLAKRYTCDRKCGRLLECGNHTCDLICHSLENPSNPVDKNCETCERPCGKSRPENCPHPCSIICHSGECPPCLELVKITCHCGLFQLNILCWQFTTNINFEELHSCKLRCPRNYECGHRCLATCHSGPCPNAEQCTAKQTFSCQCGRLQKKLTCDVSRSVKCTPIVKCNEECQRQQDEKLKCEELLRQQQLAVEELRNKKELEKYEKMFVRKKKVKRRNCDENTKSDLFLKRYWYFIIGFTFGVLSLTTYLVFG